MVFNHCMYHTKCVFFVFFFFFLRNRIIIKLCFLFYTLFEDILMLLNGVKKNLTEHRLRLAVWPRQRVTANKPRHLPVGILASLPDLKHYKSFTRVIYNFKLRNLSCKGIHNRYSGIRFQINAE